MSVAVRDVVTAIEQRYPPQRAADWDRVGLVVGEPSAAVARVLLAVDCVPETVDQALALGVELMVVHHPLLLRGVHSVATTTYKGALVHRLIRAGIGLFVAHTNADAGTPGVGDALAAALSLVDIRPLVPDDHHPARVGRLPREMSLAELTAYVAQALPATAAGVRAAGDPNRSVSTLAVVGGSGDEFLGEVATAGVDAYLTSDLRHHPASEHLARAATGSAGSSATAVPALLDAAHWATERPWLDVLAAELRRDLGVETIASDVITDVWTLHAQKEPRL